MTGGGCPADPDLAARPRGRAARARLRRLTRRLRNEVRRLRERRRDGSLEERSGAVRVDDEVAVMLEEDRHLCLAGECDPAGRARDPRQERVGVLERVEHGGRQAAVGRDELVVAEIGGAVGEVTGAQDRRRGGIWHSLIAARELEDHRLCQIPRSEEHTSELQSLTNLVCRLLLEKKKKK